MILTSEIIESGSPSGMGWTRRQLEIFGVTWPPTKGWKSALIGAEVPDSLVEEFLAAKRMSKKQEFLIKSKETALANRAKIKTNPKKKASARRASSDRPGIAPEIGVSSWAVDTQKKLLSKTNEAEDRIESLLKSGGIPYVREYIAKWEKKEFFIDFCVEWDRKIIAVEIDGAQHMTPKGLHDDRRREERIMEAGEAYSFIRLSWKNSRLITANDMKKLLTSAASLHKVSILVY